MPHVVDIADACCGCGACVVSCKRGALQVGEDAVGFMRPKLDADACVSCGCCDAVCPAQRKLPADNVVETFWAVADSELLLRSSSGGMFGLLAKWAIRCGGVVYGAAFDESFRRVRHVRAATEEELDDLLRSKYVQSVVSPGAYKQVAKDLDEGILVLFSGVACQIAALRSYVGKRADTGRLVCVEVACHGVPSPKLWRMYVDWLERVSGKAVANVNFRDKRDGWEHYSLTIGFGDGSIWSSDHDDDWYMGAYMCNATLCSACFRCACKQSCGSDITLADYWGVAKQHPEVPTASGVSAVIVHTQRGARVVSAVRQRPQNAFLWGATEHERIVEGNPSLIDSARSSADRDALCADIAAGIAMERLLATWRFYARLGVRMQARLLGVLRKVGCNVKWRAGFSAIHRFGARGEDEGHGRAGEH